MFSNSCGPGSFIYLLNANYFLVDFDNITKIWPFLDKYNFCHWKNIKNGCFRKISEMLSK